MQAWGDVVLVSNEGGRTGEETPTKASGSRTITARDWLGVVFEHPEVAAVAVDSTKRAEAAAAASRPAPTVPAPSDVQVAQRSTQPQAPTEPPMTVTADRIWAWLEQPAAATDAQPQQGPAADSETKGHKNGQKWNLREVRLRGDVIVHQDPAPDKERGLEMSGNEVDVISQGSKLYEVRAYGTVSAPARAVTDEFLIEGPIIGLDQAKNYACVIGPGKLIQENAGDGILGDIAAEPSIKQTSFTVIADETPRPADVEAKKQRGPLTIAWGRAPDGSTRDAGEGEAVQAWMKFYGRPTDTQGRPAAARAYFSNGVRAWTEDALLTCEQMWADLDDIVDFSNLPTRPGDAKTGGDTKGDESRERKRPQVARVLCQEAVRVVTRKHDEKGVLTEKRYVEGEKVTYDRATNTFHVDSAGRVDLYDRRDPKGNREAPESSQEDRREPTMASPGRGRVRPVSNRPEEPKRVRARPAKRDADPEGTAPLEMTRIWFEDQMIGQIQSTLVDTKRLAGQAEFFGDVRVMHAEVANEDAQLDPDDRPDNSIYTTSQTLRVISEPPRPGSPAGTPDRVLLQAWQDLYALSVRQGRETAIQSSDHMDYNSETGVSYIYGREDGVTIVDQTGLGQQASYGKGSTVIYNHKTGAHRVIDARSIQLVDDRTGVRAGIPPTAPERKRDKPKPRPIPRTPSGDKERRNFTGR
jgi:hypothetical protein